jgi:hypothetical protein
MDRAGSALPGFIFIAAALAAAALLIIPLRETGRKRKPGEAPPAHVH